MPSLNQPAEVKICGLSTPDTVEAAISAGASYVGVMFYPRSPRNVSLEQACSLAGKARGRVNIVAVIVDADDPLIADIASQLRPDMFQAHGRESAERIGEITRRTGIPVIKVIKVGSPEDIGAAASYHEVTSLVMFDARVPDTFVNALPGGNGIAFDWSLLAQPRGGRRFILSGGLNPGNVAEAIRITRAPIVDVSSGVERAPGVKDKGLIRKFIEAARGAR